MSSWIQEAASSDVNPYVVDGEVCQDFRIGVVEISSLPHKPSVQVLFIANIDERVLVAWPKSVWHRKASNRVVPASWVSKMTAVETVACQHYERSEPLDGAKMKIWVGFLAAEMAEMVDFTLEDCSVEYTFEDGNLPFAQALADAANDHFSFFSANEAAVGDSTMVLSDGADTEAAGHGSAQVLSRVSRLEEMMEQVASNLATLVSKQDVPAAVNRKSALRQSTSAPLSARSKAAAVPRVSIDPKPHFPSLDSGVVKAALQAGVGNSVLEQMNRLVQQNPKAAKMGDLTPVGMSPDPLSEEEDEMGEKEDGSPPSAGGTVETALVRLTDIVQTLAGDRVKKGGTSKLEAALDHVGPSSSTDGSSIGTGKRSAAARRALRSMLTESPAELSLMIERAMYEDLTSSTLGPNLSLPPMSSRAWVEHRSRIGSYRTLAHAAWGVSGALDCLTKGEVAGCRARLNILLMQLDQSAIDRGNWYLASELSLESSPPMSVLEQHRPPNTLEGESPYSRLLDPRWAEVSLSHLKEQEDFVTRRKNLGKSSTKKEEEEADPKKRPRPKAKQKALGDGDA